MKRRKIHDLSVPKPVVFDPKRPVDKRKNRPAYPCRICREIIPEGEEREVVMELDDTGEMAVREAAHIPCSDKEIGVHLRGFGR